MASLRVLFVDDESELVSTVVERLEIRGFVAAGVTSGVEALRRLQDEPFDVVILDVRMPGLGGLDVIRQIKHDKADTAVVLMSGHGSVDDVTEGKRLGAFDYLQKPVDIDHLIEVIREAAARGDGRGT